ncbi:hypothetical protein [Halococcus salifodinae]|uniref:hypothetical protein n=1 Tax=Halococcus salifodinae TaxID=36738 RepID=UPI001269516A|nr:hypothetical protein [Halococcus salifodinae]
MVDEFPDSLKDDSEYAAWVSRLAENAIRSASGQAADADHTGDLADTPESRIESETELEIDDKIETLKLKRTPYDVLRFSEQTPSKRILETITEDTPVQMAATQLAHSALMQDVLAEASREITPET